MLGFVIKTILLNFCCVKILLPLDAPPSTAQILTVALPGIEQSRIIELFQLMANYSNMVPVDLKRILLKIDSRNKNFKLMQYYNLYMEDMKRLQKLPSLVKKQTLSSGEFTSEENMRSPKFTAMSDMGESLNKIILMISYDDGKNRHELENYLKERVELEFADNEEALEVRLNKQLNLERKARALGLAKDAVDNSNNYADVFSAIPVIGDVVEGLFGTVTALISHSLNSAIAMIEVEQMEQTERIVVEEVGKIIKSTTNVMIKGFQRLENDIKDFVAITAMKSLNITLAALDQMQHNMKEGFNVISTNIKELDDRIARRSSMLELHLTQEINIATISIRQQNYITDMHSRIIDLQVSYYDAIQSSMSSQTVARLLKSCEDHRPEVLLNTLATLLKLGEIGTSIDQSKGNIAEIEALIQLMISDIQFILQVAPYCIEVLKANEEQKCAKLFTIESRAIYFLININNNILNYDTYSSQAVIKRLNNFVPEFLKTLNIDIAVHADTIVDNLSRMFPGLKFLVIISKDFHPEHDTHVDVKLKTRQIIFRPSREYAYTVVIYWFSRILDGSGYIWDDCHDTTLTYWYNKKPRCILEGYTVRKPMPECRYKSLCKIRKLSTYPDIPTCRVNENILLPCFRELDFDHKPETACYRDGDGIRPSCVYNDIVCAGHRLDNQLNNRTSRMPHVTLLNQNECKLWIPAMINYPGEKCLNSTKELDDSILRDEQAIISTMRYGASDKFFDDSVLHSTSLDCVSYFNFPDSSYTKKQLYRNKPSGYNPPISTNFHYRKGLLSEGMNPLLDRHEMKRFGFCRVGYIRYFKKVSFATNINAAFMPITNDPAFHTYDSGRYDTYITIIQKCPPNETTQLPKAINSEICKKIAKGDKKLLTEFNKQYDNFLKIIKEARLNATKEDKSPESSKSDKDLKYDLIAVGILCCFAAVCALAAALFWRKKSLRKILVTARNKGLLESKLQHENIEKSSLKKNTASK